MNMIGYLYALYFLLGRKMHLPNRKSKMFAMNIMAMFLLIPNSLFFYSILIKFFVLPDDSKGAVTKLILPFIMLLLYLGIDAYVEHRHLIFVQSFKERYREATWIRFVISITATVAPFIIYEVLLKNGIIPK